VLWQQRNTTRLPLAVLVQNPFCTQCQLAQFKITVAGFKFFQLTLPSLISTSLVWHRLIW
jgi:hypothetical protein